MKFEVIGSYGVFITETASYGHAIQAARDWVADPVVFGRRMQRSVSATVWFGSQPVYQAGNPNRVVRMMYGR